MIRKFLYCNIFTVLFLFYGCSIDSTYQYAEKQSEIVGSLRSKGYYEYNSRLNDIMKSVLNNYEREMMPDCTLNTIMEISDKLVHEKPAAGCYIIDWQPETSGKSSDESIILEWNKKDGVIIRMFTKSARVIKKLPKQSY